MSRNRATWDASECALILIDYQPEMFKGIGSSDPHMVETNVCALTKAAVAFDIPVILSTVGVKMGVNQPTIKSLRAELPELQEIDRSSMNAWEDESFLKAVKTTGRKRLVFCALWTEICLAYPVLEALRDEYEVTFVADAVAGQSKEEHEMAIERMIQAGAIPNTTIAMVAEWFRDWKSPLAAKGREVFSSLIREHRATHANSRYQPAPDSYSSQSEMM
ncbi:isochorismatase family protein [Bdellovibrio sp. KM01]|uniref:isochorismatase family protein n=1 Tax=Bdellovibrio sp. KM01 TaxID=2748865 RepID=UPI0015E9851A|nr:isochorismatase family protein [Bdellovibrio sp. KM01]QLY26704.1 isochorismatase family protein [Bdellovibrio sp. KM01]